MARTYGSKSVLSKVKVGESYYYLKDADVRAILDAINDSVFEKLKLDLGSINDSTKQNGLAVVSDIKAYVDKVAELSFDAVKIDKLPEANAENYLKYHNNIVLVPDENKTGSCIEYIIIKNDEAYLWEQIGSSATDLADYVTKATKIAGIDLQDDITATELKAALGLGSLAYKNSATGTVAGQTISGVKASFTPEGTVAVALKNNTISEVTDVGTLPSKAKDTFVAPSLATGFYTAGSAATWTGASYTKPTLGDAKTGAFATAGIKAEIGTEADAECLIFSAAPTSSAVTAQGALEGGAVNFGTFNGGKATVIDTTKFNAGSFTEGAFSAGALPTVADKTIAVDTATFTGTAGSAAVGDITVASKSVTVE